MMWFLTSEKDCIPLVHSLEDRTNRRVEGITSDMLNDFIVK
jgi:hypothetical protein